MPGTTFWYLHNKIKMNVLLIIASCQVLLTNFTTRSFACVGDNYQQKQQSTTKDSDICVDKNFLTFDVRLKGTH